MTEDQFIQHGDERHLQIVIPDETHGTSDLVLNVGSAAPCSIFPASAGVYPALESTTASAADDFAGKAVSILILPGAFDGTFFSGPLGYQRSGGFKILSADNRLMVIGSQILFLLAYIPMAIELSVGKRLLKNRVADIFLVLQHSPDGG